MFKYFFLCRVILILLSLQKRCLEVFINGVINFPYHLVTIYTYTVSLANKACHEEYSLVVHCKRETTQILFGTLYYGNFYEVLWTEILLLPLSRGLRDCWTHELCESNSWKFYDKFFWQGASYEVIVFRNLIDFTLWCSSYQSDWVGISSESSLWRL